MTEPHHRSVGIAVLLGILVPGLGQAYGGNVRRALLWFLGAVGLGTLTVRAMLTSQRPPFNLALPIALLFAYYVVEIVDAARTTARNATRPARAHDRWWVWAGVVALFLLVFTADRMTPTLLTHDYVMVDKTPTTRARGEGIAFEHDVRGHRQLRFFSALRLHVQPEVHGRQRGVRDRQRRGVRDAAERDEVVTAQAKAYICAPCGAIRSQTRQNSRISAGVPSDTRMARSVERIGGGTRMSWCFKCSTTTAAGARGFSMKKFACESMTRSMRVVA